MQVAARPVCMALLAYDTGGRRAAIAQMHRRGLATEHCCRGVDASPAAAAGNESGDGSKAGAESGVESVGERWLFPTGPVTAARCVPADISPTNSPR